VTELKQIIPAERGWHVVEYHRDPAGKIVTENGNIVATWREVACWALLEDGSVQPMTAYGDYPSLTVESRAFDGLYSPGESWRYAMTTDGDPPRGGDWEAMSCSDSGRILWRRAGD
jgi:hypothetical protein